MKNIFSYRKFMYPVILFSISSACQQTPTESITESEPHPENRIQLTAAQLRNTGITTTTLTKTTLGKTLKVNGIIDVPPQNLVSISCPMGGYLKSTDLLPGRPIKKGETIAQVEDRQFIELQQEYLLNQSKLQLAEQEYNRQKELNQNKAGSDKLLQQAETEWRNYKILLAAQAEKLKLIHIDPSRLTEQTISKSISITSPINGFVSNVNANIGKYLSPTDVLFELVNPSDIHLNLKIFEKDIASLYIGQKVMAYTNMDPAKKYPCEVILISKAVNQEGYTEVHCHFDSYDHALLPGLYMNAEIDYDASDSYVLPEEAVVLFEGKNYVYIQTDSLNYQMIEVQTGQMSKGLVEIINYQPLLNKTIVKQGAYTLLMKSKNKEEE